MIAAVETKDEIFEGFRGTRLSDPDSWKKFIQSAPPNERQYLGQVHLLLKNMAKDAKPGLRNAFIYNFRTKNSIPYDLGPSAP
jgi:eukaryotic translation initiation factor 2-alpha kinase 4